MSTGRFAPSPSGPLHLGSAAAALLSFLSARAEGGRWLVRIDDIDPPREIEGASDAILRCLEAMHLEWDGPVLFQSTRRAAYREAVELLARDGLAFACTCSRQAIRAHPDSGPDGARYPGTCRSGCGPGERALRTRVPNPGELTTFADTWQGSQEVDLNSTCGDYVIWRKDDLPAYHLANVVDDAYQGVDFVARGVDLLDSTAIHCHLHEQLGTLPPRYGHFPVVVDDQGIKLSKRTGAGAFKASDAAPCLLALMRWLGTPAPTELENAPMPEVLPWAIEYWQPKCLVGRREIPLRVLVQDS